MPLSLIRAIALHQVVEAKSRSPVDNALGAAEPKLFNNRDLAIAYQEVAVGQRTAGTLRIGVNSIIWIGEIID